MTEFRTLVSIRAARPEDGPAILAMLADLASFEGAAHAPRLDAAALARDVFGPTPMLNILIAEQASLNQFRQIDGFISYFRKVGIRFTHPARTDCGLPSIPAY